MEGYKQSKLCNLLFTNQLQVPLMNENSNIRQIIDVYSVSPGVVLTNLGRNRINNSRLAKTLFILFYPLWWFLLKRPKQGAETVIYCAIKPNLKPTSGYYFRNCKQLKLKPHAYNLEETKKLWNLSEDSVQKWLYSK